MPTRIIVPDCGDETEEILIAEWYHPNGAPVRRGEPLCRIEIDDEAYDLAAELDGELRQGIPEGHVVPPGSIVGLIVAQHEQNAGGSVLPQRPRAATRRPSTAFDMASVPDFSSDGIFSESEPKSVLGRRVLPSRGANGRTAAAVSPAPEREHEPRGADVSHLRGELVEPAPEPARSPGSVIRKLSFGRRRNSGANDRPEQTAPTPAEEPAPIIGHVNEPTHVVAEVEDVVVAETARDDWAVVTSLFEQFEDAGVDPGEPVEAIAEPAEPVAAPDAVAATPPPPPPPPVELHHEAAPPAPRPEATPHVPERPIDRREPQTAVTSPATMSALIHLGEADEMAGQLSGEWSGVSPTITDIAVRAIARAAMRLGLTEPGDDAIRLVTLTGDGLSDQVLDGVSNRSFRDLVTGRHAGEDAEHDPLVTVTDLSAVGIEAATPSLGDAALAFAIGAVREVVQADGRRMTSQPAFTLTLVFDASRFDTALAAQVLVRTKELIERPYALVAA